MSAATGDYELHPAPFEAGDPEAAANLAGWCRRAAALRARTHRGLWFQQLLVLGENGSLWKAGRRIAAGFEPERNDRCECGSGKKYKKCCK